MELSMKISNSKFREIVEIFKAQILKLSLKLSATVHKSPDIQSRQQNNQQNIRNVTTFEQMPSNYLEEFR